MSMNPAISVLVAERKSLLASIKEAEVTLREKRAALRSIEDAIAQLGGGDSGSEQEPQRPAMVGKSMREMIEQMLRQSPNGLRTTEIAERLQVIGRQTTVNSVLSTLSRLRHLNVIGKGDDGNWHYETGPFSITLNKESPEDSGPSR